MHCIFCFLVPDLLVDYCDERRMSISQLILVMIRNMVATLVLGAECRVDVDHCFFEEMNQINVNMAQII